MALSFTKALTEKNWLLYIKIVQWININDIFWLKDLRAYMQMPHDKKDDIIASFIDRLRKEGYIQCCEVKKNERQYILTKQIEFE